MEEVTTLNGFFKIILKLLKFAIQRNKNNLVLSRFI